jgi:hypothetical protein
MAGLAKICKLYGQMEIIGRDGKSVIWLWDYVNDKPRLKSEMTKEEIKASEKVKWNKLKTKLLKTTWKQNTRKY